MNIVNKAAELPATCVSSTKKKVRRCQHSLFAPDWCPWVAVLALFMIFSTVYSEWHETIAYVPGTWFLASLNIGLEGTVG